MEGKEAIVGRIIADAEQDANARKAAAQTRADQAVAAAQTRAEALLAQGRAAFRREAEEIVARRETVAGLDERKLLLAVRREAVDGALSRAVAAACAFSKKKYLSVVEELLAQNAETGDSVELAANAPVTDEELTACKAFVKKKLKFAGRNAQIEGGLRLENAVCVKDLSFRAMIEAQRGDLERELALAIFPAE